MKREAPTKRRDLDRDSQRLRGDLSERLADMPGLMVISLHHSHRPHDLKTYSHMMRYRLQRSSTALESRQRCGGFNVEEFDRQIKHSIACIVHCPHGLDPTRIVRLDSLIVEIALNRRTG